MKHSADVYLLCARARFNLAKAYQRHSHAHLSPGIRELFRNAAIESLRRALSSLAEARSVQS